MIRVESVTARAHRAAAPGETVPRGPHGRGSFHPKAYIFHADTGTIAFVGSSNLTQQALLHGIEWNYRIVSSRDGAGRTDVVQGFEALFGHPATRPLDHAWIDGYEGRRRQPAPSALPVAIEAPLPPVEPHEIQREALAALEGTRATGNRAGLVVLATGLGKTYLAALDSDRPAYRRVLFVAHREEILTQAMRAFRRVRPLARLGHYTGVEREPGADVVLASIQTLGRQAHLERFQPEDFDYLVIDEFHHAARPDR